MDKIEEALRNVDVFCRVLVRKMVDEEESNLVVEPLEKLIYKKAVTDAQPRLNQLEEHLIHLPHLEEPLIDVIEAEDDVQVLMQCRCNDEKVQIHGDANGLEICTDKCQKLELPTKNLRIENVTSKCNNNKALVISIPKDKGQI
jgi:hypothetical protein